MDVAVRTEAASEQEFPDSNDRALSFDEVYEMHVDLVWRGARALGVLANDLDDVVQDVFVVVHRKLGAFEHRSSIKTWITGVLVNEVRRYRRQLPRTQVQDVLAIELPSEVDPHRALESAFAADLLARIVASLSDDTREVFVLSEIEGLTMPAIAESLSINLSTAYSRLRLAKQQVERHLERVRCQITRSER